MSDTDWVTQRLPSDAGAIFLAKGIGTTETEAVSNAVTQALADNADRRNALASLLEIYQSDMKFKSETLDGYTYSNPVIDDRIKALREQAITGTTGPGIFTSVPIKTDCGTPSDEYSH